MATLGLSKVFILDKYFTELQKFWETEKKLQGEYLVPLVVAPALLRPRRRRRRCRLEMQSRLEAWLLLRLRLARRLWKAEFFTSTMIDNLLLGTPETTVSPVARLLSSCSLALPSRGGTRAGVGGVPSLSRLRRASLTSALRSCRVRVRC